MNCLFPSIQTATNVNYGAYCVYAKTPAAAAQAAPLSLHWVPMTNIATGTNPTAAVAATASLAAYAFPGSTAISTYSSGVLGFKGLETLTGTAPTQYSTYVTGSSFGGEWY